MDEKVERFKLSKEHQEEAKKICKNNVTKRYKKKGCKRCNSTGVKGIQVGSGIIAPCFNCVSFYDLMKEWTDYCKKFKDLKDHFKIQIEKYN